MFDFLKKPDQGEEVLLKVKGMHCSSCAFNIDDALEETAGVFKASTSYAKAETKINFDSQKATLADLKKVILDQGYQVE